MENPIVLFDGLCNLCEWSVQWILKKDSKNLFRFAALQSSTGKSLLKKFGLSLDDMNTVVLVDKERFYTKSSAGLQIARKLGGIYSLLFIFILIPGFLRNRIYDWIARNRYRWFGKKESCLIPNKEILDKFLL